MMSASEQAGQFFAELVRVSEDRDAAIHAAYQQIENAGVLSKVTVHRYVCRRGCGVLTTVVKLGEVTLARTRDYKYSPGMNLERSVPEARSKSTLDGDRHWPGHTFYVEQMASWGPVAGFDVSCRHNLRTLLAVDVLATVKGVRPGHPEKPTLL